MGRNYLVLYSFWNVNVLEKKIGCYVSSRRMLLIVILIFSKLWSKCNFGVLAVFGYKFAIKNYKKLYLLRSVFEIQIWADIMFYWNLANQFNRKI